MEVWEQVSKSMTNRSLRERFGVNEVKGAQITRIINAAIDAKLIKKMSDSEAKSEAKYQPYWS